MMLIVAAIDGDGEKWLDFRFQNEIHRESNFSEMAVMSLLLTGECSFVSKKENTSSSFISTLKS